MARQADKILEGVTVGTDDMHGDIRIQRAQEIAIDSRDNLPGRRLILHHQFAHPAIALRKNRPGRRRLIRTAAGQSEDDEPNHHPDGCAQRYLPAEHKNWCSPGGRNHRDVAGGRAGLGRGRHRCNGGKTHRDNALLPARPERRCRRRPRLGGGRCLPGLAPGQQ